MDEVARKSLHDWLDAILDRRAEIEPPAKLNALGALVGLSPLIPAVEEQEALQLFQSMLRLAIDALGEGVRRAALHRFYRTDAGQREVLRGWLNQVWPLLNAPPFGVLGIAPDQELTIFEVMDALSALDAGEIRPLFRANTGKNRRANRWSLGRAKLEALTWKKRLVALGYLEKAANFEVTKAFQEQWDTIRKWRAQCEQILGDEHVTVALELAGNAGDYFMQPRPAGGGIFGAITAPPEPLTALKNAGDRYRAELRRSVELSKRKGKRPDE
jgi:hypothetical protein